MTEAVIRDIASTMLKVGGVLLLILGIADILKGLAAIFVISVIGSVVGGYLSSAFPGLGFTSWLLPLLGPLVGGASLILGVVSAVVGYQLMKLTAPIPVSVRDRWLVITAALAAIALAFFSPWYLLAFALVIIGLLFSPSTQLFPPPPAQQS